MNNVLRIMTVIVISTNTLPSLAAGGEIEQGVKRSIEQLASKAREAKAKVANALGKDFDKQVAEAMSTLKEDPRNLKL
jgi:predicted outer membrane protein